MDKIPKFGTTPSRKRFWDAVVNEINASRKLAGRNVTVEEHGEKGTIINVSDTSKRRPPPTGGAGGEPIIGACCYDDGTCDDLTESDCDAAEGTWQGAGTSCDDEGVCVGACCEPDCVDNTTPDGCASDGGTFQGFGTTCDPNPCLLPCNGCGFDAFDGSGRVFLTKTTTRHYTQTSECCQPFSGCAQCAVDGTQTTTESYDSDCNYSSVTDPVSPLFPTSGGCNDSCDGGFINITLAPGCDTLTTISATEKSCTYGTTFSCETCSNEEGGTDTVLTVTVILSDECQPGEFSPPP